MCAYNTTAKTKKKKKRIEFELELEFEFEFLFEFEFEFEFEFVFEFEFEFEFESVRPRGVLFCALTGEGCTFIGVYFWETALSPQNLRTWMDGRGRPAGCGRTDRGGRTRMGGLFFFVHS